jgi:oligopeptide/dipeptide ABC transporter ATP-binding protein
LELIKGISRELNTSLILITHNLGIVARYAQRVFVMYAGRIVEYGKAMDVYHHPAHPYTIGLLGSVPRLDEPRKTRLTPIGDQPPDLINLPEGCAFKPRCNRISPECAAFKPELVEMGGGHYSACWIRQNGQTK